MGKIRIVNPQTGETVIEEFDDGSIVYVSEEYKRAMKESKEGGYVPSAKELDKLIDEIEKMEESEEEEDEEGDADKTEEGVVPYRSGPVIDSGSWDGSVVKRRLAKWASSDGSGKKDKVSFNKYRMGFLIVDGPVDNFGSYKYPHHDVKNGVLYVHKQGVISAMAFLLRVRPPETASAYRHLSKHYRSDLGMDPPPLKKEALTDAEMAEYFGENWVNLITW